jgi:carbonic anhydrase
MKKTTLLILVTALAIIILFCSNSKKKGDEKEKKGEKKEKVSEKKHDKEDCSHVHWGYEGEEAPENWVNLCSKFTPCGGKSQSPINIQNAEPKEDLATLEFQYNDTKTDIINNGHTVQFNVSGDNK